MPLTPQLAGFSQDFEKIIYTCVMITGLGRALLSTQHPSWRLPAIADSVALAIKPFPARLACVLLVLVSIAQLTNATGMSSEVVISVRVCRVGHLSDDRPDVVARQQNPSGHGRGRYSA